MACHGKFGPPQISSPRNLFSGKFVPPGTFVQKIWTPLTEFGPPCHCVSFEQTIIYTWSIHTKEAIHNNKFKIVYSSITHKEQNKLLVTTMTIAMYVSRLYMLS